MCVHLPLSSPLLSSLPLNNVRRSKIHRATFFLFVHFFYVTLPLSPSLLPDLVTQCLKLEALHRIILSFSLFLLYSPLLSFYLVLTFFSPSPCYSFSLAFTLTYLPLYSTLPPMLCSSSLVFFLSLSFIL